MAEIGHKLGLRGRPVPTIVAVTAAMPDQKRSIGCCPLLIGFRFEVQAILSHGWPSKIFINNPAKYGI